LLWVERSLAILPYFGSGVRPCLEVGHHDLLVRDDDHEHIGRHDRRRQRAQVQQRRAPA
jgi:hypothetical protein